MWRLVELVVVGRRVFVTHQLARVGDNNDIMGPKPRVRRH